MSFRFLLVPALFSLASGCVLHAQRDYGDYGYQDHHPHPRHYDDGTRYDDRYYDDGYGEPIPHADSYRYYGYHPVPDRHGHGWCFDDSHHFHVYAPLRVRYSYVGDAWRYRGPVSVWYYDHHPTPLGSLCGIRGRHSHGYHLGRYQSHYMTWNRSAGAYRWRPERRTTPVPGNRWYSGTQTSPAAARPGDRPGTVTPGNRDRRYTPPVSDVNRPRSTDGVQDRRGRDFGDRGARGSDARRDARDARDARDGRDGRERDGRPARMSTPDRRPSPVADPDRRDSRDRGSDLDARGPRGRAFDPAPDRDERLDRSSWRPGSDDVAPGRGGRLPPPRLQREERDTLRPPPGRTNVWAAGSRDEAPPSRASGPADDRRPVRSIPTRTEPSRATPPRPLFRPEPARPAPSRPTVRPTPSRPAPSRPAARPGPSRAAPSQSTPSTGSSRPSRGSDSDRDDRSDRGSRSR